MSVRAWDAIRMFSQPVVIVIGAGASAECGMPTGSELKDKVAAAVQFLDTKSGRGGGDRDLYSLLHARFEKQIRKYLDAGTELSEVISSFVSIDEALNWFASRPEVVELGKVAIVREILKAERESLLYSAENPRIIPEIIFQELWLSHFLSMTMSSLKREDMEQAFKNVTIINFNYDRTLEHFLYSALQSDYDLSEPEARKALATFKVIRPYGVIGGLEWQEDGRLPFGEKLHQDHERLFSLAKGIRTYTEQITGELLQQIQPTMERARLVIFLGFGYHQQNMNLLRAKSAEAWRRAFGTVKGIEPENYETMEEAIAQITGLLSHKPKLLPWDAQKLLMDMRPALMAAAGM